MHPPPWCGPSPTTLRLLTRRSRAPPAWRACGGDCQATLPGRRAGGHTAVQTRVIAALRRTIAALETSLSKNSPNSSLPPPSDRFWNKATLESSTRAERRALGRKPGKEPGADGKHLAQVEYHDETFVYSPSCCDNCGGDHGDAPVKAVEVRRVLDTPVPQLEYIEPRAETRSRAARRRRRPFLPRPAAMCHTTCGSGRSPSTS
jgi:hypothetical protein